MQTALAGLRRKWEAEGKAPLSSGIGINTGEVLVGNIGAEGKKMDYTVIGDQVNLCSRVEALTRRYDVPILATGNTLQKLAPGIADGTVSGFALRGLEQVIVKGKEEPVPIYALEELADRSAPASFSPCPVDRVVRLTEK
jgi:adenylate cyclase